jgi:hypothetical protein
MKVVDEKDNGVFLLLPESDWEGLDNLAIFATARLGGELAYAGRVSEKGSRFFSMKFKTGDIQLVVKGSTEEDKLAIAKLRSLCFHGTLNRMVLHGFVPTDYGIGLVLTSAYCKNCGRPIIERASWEMCHDCAEKVCPHESYEKRMLSDGQGAFLCRICVKCGLPDPVDVLRLAGLTPEERMAEVQRANPSITFIMSKNPMALPLAVATALRSNN